MRRVFWSMERALTLDTLHTSPPSTASATRRCGFLLFIGFLNFGVAWSDSTAWIGHFVGFFTLVNTLFNAKV